MAERLLFLDPADVQRIGEVFEAAGSQPAADKPEPEPSLIDLGKIILSNN